MKKNELDMAWGNPYFLLKILEDEYRVSLLSTNVGNMSYAPDAGFPELIQLTRDVIKTTIGSIYKFIIITNGATHAINTLLRVYRDNDKKTVGTQEYGYPFYGDMIKRAGLKRVNHLNRPSDFLLIDSPSNPLGHQIFIGNPERDIWDAVYHNNIYTDDLETKPKHLAMVGSYSKLLGLTGARIGFVATNDVYLAMQVENYALKDNATVSVPSQRLIIDILKDIDLESFMFLGRASLNDNRGQLQKIEYLFDGQAVQSVGMFYCAHADEKTLQILKKCGIKYIDLGDNFTRLSMGQTREITKKAVKTILKEDRR